MKENDAIAPVIQSAALSITFISGRNLVIACDAFGFERPIGRSSAGLMGLKRSGIGKALGTLQTIGSSV